MLAMMVRLLCCCLLLCHIASAQLPFSDGKTMHARTILEGRATIELPDDYSAGNGAITIGDGDEPVITTSYHSKSRMHNIYCVAQRSPHTLDSFKSSYAEMKTSMDTQYLIVLRDELVLDRDNSYFYLEYRLKDGFYNNQTGMMEIDDGSVYPNHFIFHYTLRQSITIDSGEPLADLEKVTQLNKRIINSFKLL